MCVSWLNDNFKALVEIVKREKKENVQKIEIFLNGHKSKIYYTHQTLFSFCCDEEENYYSTENI